MSGLTDKDYPKIHDRCGGKVVARFMTIYDGSMIECECLCCGKCNINPNEMIDYDIDNSNKDIDLIKKLTFGDEYEK